MLAKLELKKKGMTMALNVSDYGISEDIVLGRQLKQYRSCR
jgi:hypothetical protein